MKLQSSQVDAKSKRSTKQAAMVKREHRARQRSKARTGRNNSKSKKKGRYAPKAVRDSLTPSEKAYENRKKRKGTKQGKQHVPRGKSAKKK